MNFRFWATGTSWTAASCLALAAVVAAGATPAEAAKKRQDSVAYGRSSNPPPLARGNGPNVSYMAGPHTRIYVSKRSWLDAGTEVQPGDRHYLDYVLQPGHSAGINNIQGPAAPAGWQNPNWPLLGVFEAPGIYSLGW